MSLPNAAAVRVLPSTLQSRVPNATHFLPRKLALGPLPAGLASGYNSGLAFEPPLLHGVLASRRPGALQPKGENALRHYEIVLLVHPDQSEQVPGMLERYKSVVEAGGGRVHRSEDWGRLQLAYTIEKLHKAHYIMINIECDAAVLEELETIFRFNDAILRHLTIRKDQAETEPSVMMKRKERKDEGDARRRSRPVSEFESDEDDDEDDNDLDEVVDESVDADIEEDEDNNARVEG